MIFRPIAHLGLLLGICASTCALAVAQPVPAVNAPAPISVQRGQSANVTLSGSSLANVSSVALPDDSGLTATLAKPDKPNDAEARLTLKADADAKPGVREIRLVSSTGVSNPVQVWVEQYPLIVDTQPNTDPAKPQPISLPAIISGKIDAPGDIDNYRFTALKGQQLVFNMIAARTRSPLDGVLTISDAASGRELMSNNDTFGADPFLAFDVPADGQYILEVRDLQYRGAPEYTYRIEAGAIPFVQSLTPSSSRRGAAIDVKASGYNLGGAAETIHLDLRYVNAGRIPVQVKTSTGYSNEIPFDVTELPQAAEIEPNDDAKSATPAALGTEISGVIGKPDDVDFFRIKIDKPTRIVADALAGRIGSALDPLLTLFSADGKQIRISDDAAGVDARLSHELQPGEYLLSIRDIGYNGGPSYAYRLTLQSTLATGDTPPQDFSLKFQPDAPRVHRGGFVKFWCDVARQNFPADVTITVEGLPPGITVASPTVFKPVNSGILMLQAKDEAPLGTFPITIKATAPLDGELVTRNGQPEITSRVVQQAYLTILEAAPLAIQPLATVAPERIEQLNAQIPPLAAKVLGSSSELDARQAEWEKKVATEASWVVLKPAALSSTGKASLAEQPDGSILAGGRKLDKDAYTFITHTSLKGIAAIRLECLPHPSLGSNGPGRAPNGNFVLSRIAATVAPKANPSESKPAKFSKAQATFSQADYDVAGAIDGKKSTGWAISPQTGQPQTAFFTFETPVGDGTDIELKLTLEQNFGLDHTLGHFRLSVSTDPAAVNAAPVPDNILAIVKTPKDKRTGEQASQLAAYYRNLDPVLAADRTKLDLLRFTAGVASEMARLDASLHKQFPQLDAEQAAWEKSLAAGMTWMPLVPTDLRASSGANLAKEADGSVFVFGATAPIDTYTFVAPSPLKSVTGLRVEAIPDPRLPGNGPGRSKNGNFILSSVKVAVAPTTQPAAATQPVQIDSASASYAQDNYPASAALDDKPETGWAIGPLSGQPAAAEFFFKSPQNVDGKSTFTITLDHAASAIPQHALGRFRLSMTNAPDADASVRLPANILAILGVPPDKRTPEMRNDIAAYHRRISKLLQPARQRLTEFRSVIPAYPPTIQRGKPGFLSVAINRGKDFPAGDVQVSLEGFSLGRDANGPVSIARSLKLAPLTITGDQVVGVLTFVAEGNAEQGTRLVVLKAEAKVGNDTIVQYSPAFPLTVN